MIPSLLVLAAAAILPISNVAKSDDTQATKVVQGKAVSQWVMVGSYTDGPGDGIHVYELNPENGNLRLASVGPKTISPSFLVASADSQFVYAVNETANFDGNGAGAVSAFQFNKRTGKLTYLNSQTSGGNGPCHICLDKSGKFVMVANYGGGSIESIGVKADGSLGRVITFIQHKGTSADPKRQEGPHAHSVYFDPSGKYLVVNDLGLDRVFTYKFDAVSGELTAVKGGGMTTAPGAGPRHLAFHPNGKFAYVINELDSTINACNWMPKTASFAVFQTVSTKPADFVGNNSTAEIFIDPTGKFVYGSNRGDNSLACFAIDPAKGTLTLVGHTPTQGKIPRSFMMDPSGTFLIAVNQESNDLYVFKRNIKSGELTLTESSAFVNRPVCVIFVPK